MASDEHRVPPIDLMAEAKVIAAILDDGLAFDEVADRLKSYHFYDDKHRTIYTAFEGLRQNEKEIGLPDVIDWLDDNRMLQRAGGIEYIDAELFQKTPSVIDPNKDASRIIDRYMARQFIATAKQSAAEVYLSTPGDNAEIVSRHLTEVAALIDGNESNPELSMKEAVSSYSKKLIADIQTRQRLEAEGKSIIEIPTGITKLDKLLVGLHRGNLTIIAGRPGMGKSAVGYLLGTNCAGKLNYENRIMASAFVSLEMPYDQLVMRAGCMESRVGITKVREFKLSDQENQRYFAALGDIAKKPIYIADRVTDIEEVLARIRRMKVRCEKEGVELTTVVIDYLQLITCFQGKNQTRENVVGQISRRMKSAAKSLGVVMILLAQLNRECEASADKRPRLHHLRESGSLEQDADDVIFLFRDDYYREKESRAKQNKKDKTEAYNDPHEEFVPNNLIELDVAKQRNGPTGMVQCRWTPACTRVDNLANEEEPADA